MNQQTYQNRDPQQVRFSLKCNEVRNYEKLGLCVVCFASYFRISKHSHEQEESYIAALILIYTMATLFMIVMLKTEIKTVKQLNVRVFVYDKLYFLITSALTFLKLKQSNGMQQYDFFYITLAFQSMLHSCYIIPLKLHCLNIIGTWTLYILLLLVMSSSPDKINIIVFIIVFIFYMVKKQTFSLNLERDMDSLYKELKQSQSLLTQILSYLPEGVLIFNSLKQSRKITYWNTSAHEIILPEQVVGSEQITVEDIDKINIKQTLSYQNLNLEENFFESGQARNHILQEQKTLWNAINNMENLEIKQFKFSKRKKHIEAFKISLEQSQEIMIFLRDITAIRDKQRSEISKQMQTVFLSSITHDLKTPINQIRSTNTYLQSNIQCKKEKKILKMQETSCVFMLSLIDDIIDMSKFELKKFELTRSTFSLQELVNEVCELVQMKIEEKNLQLEKQVGQDVPDFIFTDRKRLKQILMNLLSNATKFTFEGSIIIQVETKRNLSQDQVHFESSNRQLIEEEEKKEGDFDLASSDTLQISVIDSGIGISSQNQKKLFKLFGMVGKNTKINPNGTGLGLVICKRLVEAMNGSIKVTSEEGKGSTFTVSLRLSEVEILRNQNNSNLFLDTSRSSDISSVGCIERLNSFPQLNVLSLLDGNIQKTQVCNNCSKYLVIDDDPFNIFAFQLLLESFSVGRMDSSLSGLEGIEKMKAKLANCCQTPYKFVAIDLNMPQMNGDEIMKKIQQMIQEDQGQMQRYSATKFVLCTAQAQENLEYFRRIGFHYFIEKPISSLQISQILALSQ